MFLVIEILWNVLDFLPAAAAMLGEMGGVEILEGLLRQLLTNGYRKQARGVCCASPKRRFIRPNPTTGRTQHLLSSASVRCGPIDYSASALWPRVYRCIVPISAHRLVAQ